MRNRRASKLKTGGGKFVPWACKTGRTSRVRSWRTHHDLPEVEPGDPASDYLSSGSPAHPAAFVFSLPAHFFHTAGS